jgi:biotin carboxylase
MDILCLASYEKGHEFLREAKRQGATVLLLTSLSLREKAVWPTEAIDEIFYMPDDAGKWNTLDTIHAVSHLARSRNIERIVPLDDFDLELAATLREHLRIPGMGETTTRYFRDKLSMRMGARDAGLNVPEFVHVLNDRRLNEYMQGVPPPWVLKPRLMAGAIGVKKVDSAEQVWELINALGDQRSYYLLERYVPGDVYHVDSIVHEREILFAVASAYGRPPMDVSHGGGIFTTRLLERGSETEQALLEKNRRVLDGLRLLRGVSHTEYIIGREDGRVYFLETSARVGGAHIADLIEAATGLNLWREWAKIEIAGGKSPYSVSPIRDEYAALLISLARQEKPDLSAYTDPEVVWRMNRNHHAGLIVRSLDHRRVMELLESYTRRFLEDFSAVLPPAARPST